MKEKLKELKARLGEINDIEAVLQLLEWEQQTYMPPGGAPARGRQLATLGRLAHEKFVDPAIGVLLDELEAQAADLAYDSDEASLLRVTRRDYEQAIRVPSEFLSEYYAHTSESLDVWTRARPENDFAAVQPYLEKTLELSRQYTGFFPGCAHIADPLIDLSDYGMKAESVRVLFADLREQLVPLVQAIAGQPPADDNCLRHFYPKGEQLAFGLKVTEQCGYDFSRGRQDIAAHPFMTKFSLNDVRITTRVQEDFLDEALFGSLHEAGHALYEQGIDQSYEATPLASGTSSGLHESQSRLWENQVGRGRPFWKHFYPQLQETFPKQLEAVSPDTFYRAINRVEPSLIRTDADQVTYDLHVMIRFDLELAMLEGELAIKDLPEAWNARYQSDLGLHAPDDVDGVLQDIHWYSGYIGGAFQGYTLGNIMSALFYDQALKAHPEIPAEIERGEFGTLLGWLREHVYRHGRKFTAGELVERVTGRPLTIEPYIRYLKSKFGELYQL